MKLARGRRAAQQETTSVVGWSASRAAYMPGAQHRWRRRGVVTPSASPSMAEPAPATILWNSSAPMPPRAAEGQQQPARRQQLQRQAVDVLVGARRALGVGGGGRELGRVQHDGVEALARLQALAQELVDVGVDHAVARGVEAVGLHVRAGALQRRRRRIDAGHVRRRRRPAPPR
jgi:hypothetical protein